MRRYRFCAALAVFIALITAFTAGAFAQSVRGVLSGSVTAPSGAVVAGAKIHAINANTGVSFSTDSTSSGSYQFAELPLGTYNVTVTAVSGGVVHSTVITLTVN